MKKFVSTIKDHLSEIRLFNQRTLCALIGVFILTSLLIGRLFYLQVIEHRLYTTLSLQNQLNLLPLEPKRGLIYDRHGVILAQNTPAYSLEIIPQYVPNLTHTLNELQALLPIDEEEIQAFYRVFSQLKHYQGIPLKVRLTPEEVAKFALNQYRFPGVHIKAHLIREYPQGAAFGNVVGYVGRINAQELSNVDEANYTASNFIGKTGVEKYYEEALHGTNGYQQIENDVTGRVVRTLKTIPPVAGENLKLTLDSRLQLKALETFGDTPGALVALDPNNGEILALVSNPTFDPNLFVNGISHEEYQTLQQAAGRPLYDRALRGQYPMASTIKPYLALMGLASAVVTANTTIFDPGYYRLENSSHIFHDWQRFGHGTVNIVRALMVSCDVYFFNLAHKLGIRRIDSVLDQFGFGKITGVDLPEEATGVIASPEWKLKKLKTPWYPGDTVNTSIGQGYMLATPLQMASAVATIAMRGLRYQPHILLRIEDSTKEVEVKPIVPLPKVIFSKETWDTIIQGMQAVMQPGGTGLHKFGQVSYAIAAKTGTAQVFSFRQNKRINAQDLPLYLRDHSLFIAFAPVDHPKIALMVIAEHSAFAAKIARKVIDLYLEKTS